MSANSSSPASIAQDYVSNPRFHQTLKLEPTATHGTLDVTYAEFGREPDEASAIPTILFMPGMFASRYLGLALHPIATKLGVRVLVVDRPGMGGSTDVPLAQRVSTWIETVPRLLAHLGIQHVALVSHSAGTMYLFNTLSYCRDSLYPDAPVTLLAPWVDPAFSHITSMQLAQYIPNKAFSLWNRIPRFFLLQAGPAFASSGAVVKKVSNAMSPSGSTAQDITEQEKTWRYVEEVYGLSREVQAELDTLMFQRMFQESTVGSNSEALQCLRKEASTWGTCENYKVFVRDWIGSERGREGPSLKVRAYFGESDSMIGKKGQEYFEGCWHEVNDGEQRHAVDFMSTTVPGTDHDTLVQSIQTWEKIIGDVTGALNHVSQSS